MSINTALKQARLNNKSTQKQIADMLGIAEVSYRRYEINQRKPSIDVLIKLANFYNISLDELVGRKFPR